MYSRFTGLALLVPCLLAAPVAHSTVPTCINFNGALHDASGIPVPDGGYQVTFAIWDSPQFVPQSQPLWSETLPITTMGGLFTVLLGKQVPINPTLFSTASRYLGIQVVNDPEMMPRTELVSVAYAFRIGTVDGATGGDVYGDLTLHSTFTSGDYVGDAGHILVTNGSAPTLNLDGPTGDFTAYGKATIGPLNSNLGTFAFVAGALNQATGDNSSVGGGQLNLASGVAANVSGGRENQATGFAATVGGGLRNTASGDSATVGGGALNTASAYDATVGGGWANSASGWFSTIGGGASDTCSGERATIAGGWLNFATNLGATVGGGFGNHADGIASTIGGGNNNQTGNSSATVPGGWFNTANGSFSFAAGHQAKALHGGSFVWSDASVFDFASTAIDQWSARCTGGARFVSAIDGLGNATAGVTLSAGGGSWASISDRNAKENIEHVDGDELLAKLSLIPINKWNYVSQDDAIRHIGPMAQDFYAAFGVGEDDKHITTIDADGVALAAIQALHARTKEIDDLKVQVAELQKLMKQLVGDQINR